MMEVAIKLSPSREQAYLVLSYYHIGVSDALWLLKSKPVTAMPNPMH